MSEQSVLIASASEKGAKFFSDIFPNAEAEVISSAEGVGSALSKFDFVIVDAPLKDEFGTSFAVACAKLVPTILIVKKERYEQAAQLVEAHGVLVVAKPVNAQTLRYIVRAIDVLRGRVRELENKLEDAKLVNRAKLVLISTLKLTEAQAHKHIEQQAMNRRVTRREIAMNILTTYEERV